MGALAVNQLLVNSQDKGVELTLETAPLENQVCEIKDKTLSTSSRTESN